MLPQGLREQKIDRLNINKLVELLLFILFCCTGHRDLLHASNKLLHPSRSIASSSIRLDSSSVSEISLFTLFNRPREGLHLGRFYGGFMIGAFCKRPAFCFQEQSNTRLIIKPCWLNVFSSLIVSVLVSNRFLDFPCNFTFGGEQFLFVPLVLSTMSHIRTLQKVAYWRFTVFLLKLWTTLKRNCILVKILYNITLSILILIICYTIMTKVFQLSARLTVRVGSKGFRGLEIIKQNGLQRIR